MAISEGHRANYQTLLRAAADGNLALMECRDRLTGQPITVLCAVQTDGEDIEFVPFAKLFDGNPYDEVDPPA